MTSKSKRDLRVLVADPIPHMGEIVANMLRTLGVNKIRESKDVSAAMVELKERPFDVLIIDDGFQQLSSVEFIKRLRACADCRNRDVPIIMMSSLPEASQIARARDAGVNEFLRKPFSANHLQARLTTIFAAPREFIAVDAYAGPDRRRRDADFSGRERRTGQRQRDSA